MRSSWWCRRILSLIKPFLTLKEVPIRKVRPGPARGPKLRASARLRNLIERVMQLAPEKRQILAEAMEYSVQATMAGKSRGEILLEVRSLLNGKS